MFVANGNVGGYSAVLDSAGTVPYNPTTYDDYWSIFTAPDIDPAYAPYNKDALVYADLRGRNAAGATRREQREDNASVQNIQEKTRMFAPWVIGAAVIGFVFWKVAK